MCHTRDSALDLIALRSKVAEKGGERKRLTNRPGICGQCETPTRPRFTAGPAALPMHRPSAVLNLHAYPAPSLQGAEVRVFCPWRARAYTGRIAQHWMESAAVPQRATVHYSAPFFFLCFFGRGDCR